MSEQNKTTGLQVVDPKGVLADSLEKTKEFYPKMVESTTKAVAALSKVKKIENDTEDAVAQKLLVAVKATYDKVYNWRTSITGELDTLKEQLMEPEKRISLQKSHKDSDALRVKSLRDEWANKKLKEQQEKEQAIAADQAKKEELANLRMLFENTFYEGVMNQLSTMESNIEAFFNGLQLETFDEKAKKFNVAPKLSQEYYEGLFIVKYDQRKLPVKDFNEFLTKVKGQYTYENINGLYVKKAGPILDSWKAKLPAKKKELEDLAELAKTNAVEAAKKKKALDAQAAKEKKEREAKATKELQEKKAETQQQANIEIQDAAFEAQVGQQSMEELKNVRKTKVATITCEDVNIVKVLSQVMFACFTNPKFKGHIKKDRTTGLPQKDADGRPVYEDWCETLLDFYANSCDVAIDGVELKQVVSTIQKKSK